MDAPYIKNKSSFVKIFFAFETRSLFSLLFPLCHCAEVFEEVLEIVSYMTFYSPTISLEMWSLWPLLMEALADWAIDFFESKYREAFRLIN